MRRFFRDATLLTHVGFLVRQQVACLAFGHCRSTVQLCLTGPYAKRTIPGMDDRPRVLSGARPTGRLHLGHLWGVLANWKALQEDYTCYFFIADWHALTEDPRKSLEFRTLIEEIVIDWLTAGVDPDRAVLFVQSWVPEHVELHMVFSMLVNLSRLLRMPTLKEHVASLRTEEFRGTRKGELDRATREAVQHVLSRYPDLQGHPDRVSILTAEAKQTFMEALRAATEEEDEELSYGHLVSYGRLGYPVLQSADVLLYRPKFVPVGEDQLSHLELTREIARRFNRTYKTRVFPIPKPLLTEFPKVPGTDGRKMSKSYNNTILIGEEAASLEKKIRRMYTDPQKIRKNDPGRPEICPVFQLHRMVTPEEEQQSIATDCRSGTLGCVACKGRLVEQMEAFMAPLRERRQALERERDTVWDRLREGTEKARALARDTMSRVRAAMGMPEPPV